MNTDRQDNSDEWCSVLPGLELQHDLTLVLANWNAWDALAAQLVKGGGEIHALQMMRQRDGVSVRCRVKRLSAECTRALTRSFAEEEGVQVLGLEHLMLARTTQAPVSG